LLIALVGSIVLTLQTRHDVKKQSVAQQRSRDADNSVFLVSLDRQSGYRPSSKNKLYIMLDNRFYSLLVKHGQNPIKVRKDLYKSLILSGFSNPALALSLVVNSIVLPLETKKRRRGRNFLSVPFPITKERQEGLVLHKLIKIAKQSKGSLSFGERLSFHIVQTLRGTGPLVQDRQETLRTLK